MDVLEEEVKVRTQSENLDIARVKEIVAQQQWQQLPDELQIDGRLNLHFEGSFPQEDPMSYQADFTVEAGSL
ncbi:MAG: hypothetical protein U5L96_16995 [Owenweeksia sp.]|nr:hypothetical protein [Owenweeksia sp.]